jgi:hypothetical protein
MYPPPSCTRLDVIVTYDDYPEETGFRLLDAYHPEQQSMIFEPAGKTNIPRRASVAYSYQLPIGNYTFLYEDTSLDGNCCEYGVGEAVVRNGDKGLTISGDFDDFIIADLPNVGVQGDTVGWGEADGSGSYTGMSGQSGNIHTVFGIQIIIRYDPDHVDAITWYLKLVDTSVTGDFLLLRVDAPGPDRVLDQYNRQSLVFRDLPAGEYEFHIENSSSQGLSPGTGFARVTLLDNLTGVFLRRLYHVGGEYIRDEAVARFELGDTGGVTIGGGRRRILIPHWREEAAGDWNNTETFEELYPPSV